MELIVQYRYLCPIRCALRICTMDWFIKKVAKIKLLKLDLLADICKGQTVEEHKPFRLSYANSHWVSDGKPSAITVNIYACADPDNNGAPMYLNSKELRPHELKATLIHKTGNVVKLVELNADLGLVPEEKFPRKANPNGVHYYKIFFQIEVTYFSAYTKYELIHDNINYGAVSAEYV